MSEDQESEDKVAPKEVIVSQEAIKGLDVEAKVSLHEPNPGKVDLPLVGFLMHQHCLQNQ